MPTIIKIKERQADKLYECAEKVHRGAKKLMEFIEDEILESEEFDEQHLALYVKDVVDDVDVGDGEIMREWDAKMTSRGIAVDWEEIL